MQLKNSGQGIKLLNRVCRIAMLVLFVAMVAVFGLQMGGVMPKVWTVIYILGLGLLGVALVMLIAAIRKRMRTPRMANNVTVVLTVITCFVLMIVYSFLTAYSAINRAVYATVQGDKGDIVVLKTLWPMPEGTTAQSIAENGLPMSDSTEDDYYVVYEAYPVQWKWFYNVNSHVEGIAMTKIDLETNETDGQLMVDKGDGYVRFYIEGTDPEVTGEIRVYND